MTRNGKRAVMRLLGVINGAGAAIESLLDERPEDAQACCVDATEDLNGAKVLIARSSRREVTGKKEGAAGGSGGEGRTLARAAT